MLAGGGSKRPQVTKGLGAVCVWGGDYSSSTACDAAAPWGIGPAPLLIAPWAGASVGVACQRISNASSLQRRSQPFLKASHPFPKTTSDCVAASAGAARPQPVRSLQP
jgi:hypothetical protein